MNNTLEINRITLTHAITIHDGSDKQTVVVDQKDRYYLHNNHHHQHASLRTLSYNALYDPHFVAFWTESIINQNTLRDIIRQQDTSIQQLFHKENSIDYCQLLPPIVIRL